ncbi:precorrin-8X methylmutase [Oscillospiraceae bacterium LTW-04]|nr:precorrin-8X methylmutase [Oscillospiraceae bacterium MB24-C1]
MTGWRALPPAEIERRSFEIITQELGETDFSSVELLVLKRVIHTTADFEYTKTLYFSQNAAEQAITLLMRGAHILTDTNMAKAGVNKTALAKLGGDVHCFMADEQVAQQAKERGITRAAVSMEKTGELPRPLIVAVGNAPTALLRLHEMIAEGVSAPDLIIAAPVGFVNVIESKQVIEAGDIPCIVARGRRGGSTVAAAVCNALLYEAVRRVKKLE